MLLLPCEEVTRLVSKSLDQKLPLVQRIIVQVHLFRCHACTRFRKQVFFLREVLHQHAESIEVDDTSPPKLSPEARARIKRSLQNPEIPRKDQTEEE